jgi:pimeloyl-ACP methyl ester carboxylesterase
MIRALLIASMLVAVSLPATAEVTPFPSSFRTQDIAVDGAKIHVRVGGKGPAVVMLHGFGDTGDMWAPLAADLAKDHTVVVPDLRGLGLSSIPEGGYEKKNQAGDVRGVLAALGIENAVVSLATT